MKGRGRRESWEVKGKLKVRVKGQCKGYREGRRSRWVVNGRGRKVKGTGGGRRKGKR